MAPDTAPNGDQDRITATAALTVLAQEIHLRDSLAEGTVVASISFENRERYNPLTGEVTKPRIVETSSMPARWIVFEHHPDGRHIHGPDTSSVSVQTFDWDEQVRVIRPAPMAPCKCGFPEAKSE